MHLDTDRLPARLRFLRFDDRRTCAGSRPSEMLDEVLFSERESGKKISNIVLMGIGEPLDNFENVIKFLRLVNNPNGMNIGMRHISLSTCGLTEKFDKLAELNLQLTLSVSLHAPDDPTRSKLMPANNGGVFRNCWTPAKGIIRRPEDGSLLNTQ
jgi:adenine C2-methylase RlmN of 23S rRNA A2503 and tRNA A37